MSSTAHLNEFHRLTRFPRAVARIVAEFFEGLEDPHEMVVMRFVCPAPTRFDDPIDFVRRRI